MYVCRYAEKSALKRRENKHERNNKQNDNEIIYSNKMYIHTQREQRDRKKWKRTRKKDQPHTVEWSYKHQIMNITKSKNYEQWSSASSLLCASPIVRFFDIQLHFGRSCLCVCNAECSNNNRTHKYAHTASMCTLYHRTHLCLAL